MHKNKILIALDKKGPLENKNDLEKKITHAIYKNKADRNIITFSQIHQILRHHHYEQVAFLYVDQYTVVF